VVSKILLFADVALWYLVAQQTVNVGANGVGQDKRVVEVPYSDVTWFPALKRFDTFEGHRLARPLMDHWSTTSAVFGLINLLTTKAYCWYTLPVGLT
jgi:hypothetical protein